MNQLPAHLQNRQSRGLTERGLANVGPGAPPTLSIASNRFTLVDAAGNTMAIPELFVDTVIIDINEHVSKIYFPDNYDPNDPIPPACFSDNGLAPSTAASQPQSEKCATCQWNVWGSKISQLGNEVKACADVQKVAVIAPKYGSASYVLRIPPGSFKNWRAYLAKMAAIKLEPDMVITRLTFVDGAVGTLKFESPGYLDAQTDAFVQQVIASKVSDLLVGRLDRPRMAALPAGDARPLDAPSAGAPPPISAPMPASVPTPAAAGLPISSAELSTDRPLRIRHTTPIASGPIEAITEPQRKRRGRPSAQPQASPSTSPASPLPQQAPFRPDPPPNTQFGIATNAPAPPEGLDVDGFFAKK